MANLIQIVSREAWSGAWCMVVILGSYQELRPSRKSCAYDMRGRPPTRVTIRGISHTLTSRYWGDALGKPQFLSSLLKSVLTSSARDELSRDAVQEAKWAQLDPKGDLQA
jgi:hypothetical protein